jgi:hypothetical protein
MSRRSRYERLLAAGRPSARSLCRFGLIGDEIALKMSFLTGATAVVAAPALLLRCYHGENPGALSAQVPVRGSMDRQRPQVTPAPGMDTPAPIGAALDALLARGRVCAVLRTAGAMRRRTACIIRISRRDSPRSPSAHWTSTRWRWGFGTGSLFAHQQAR